MKEKLSRIIGNRFIQWVFGGSLLTLLADVTNTFHSESALAVTATAGKCDSIGAAIIAIFTGGC